MFKPSVKRNLGKFVKAKVSKRKLFSSNVRKKQIKELSFNGSQEQKV